jgi:hypothetical protein
MFDTLLDDLTDLDMLALAYFASEPFARHTTLRRSSVYRSRSPRCLSRTWRRPA